MKLLCARKILRLFPNLLEIKIILPGDWTSFTRKHKHWISLVTTILLKSFVILNKTTPLVFLWNMNKERI